MAERNEINVGWTKWLIVLAVVLATAASLTAPRSASAAENPFLNEKFYVDPNSKAKQTEAQWRSEGRTADADELKTISEAPADPRYFAEWTEVGDSGGVEFQVRHWVGVYKAAGALPTIGAYAIPNRDCGSYSGGGFATAQEYKNWIDGFARGIGDDKVVVILEPDALPGMSCLSDAMKQDRLSLLKYAVYSLKSRPNAHVYIDAGHSAWQTPQTMIDRLKQAGIERADGFATNNANFRFSSNEISWGKQVSAGVSGKHFVVDTSRNGLGPYEGGTHSGDCAPQFNPPGRALGTRPTANTGEPLVDAFFWLKQPGESDGACGPYPRAGAWVPEYALGLAQRASSSITADRTAPNTGISSGPAQGSFTRNTSASFEFVASETGAKFQCSLDGAAFAPCASPKLYSSLTSRSHTLRVAAMDTVGNVDSTPATRTWILDAVLPTVTYSKPASDSKTRDRTPTISGIVKDSQTNLAKSNITLFLDGKQIGASKFSYSSSTDKLTFTPGTNLFYARHTARINGRDAAGNIVARQWSFYVTR